MPLKDVVALWKKDKTDSRGNAMYSGQTQEDITIPKGTWLTLFLNDKGDNPKRPDLKLAGDAEEIQFGSDSQDRAALPPGANRRKHEPIDAEGGDIPW